MVRNVKKVVFIGNCKPLDLISFKSRGRVRFGAANPKKSAKAFKVSST